MGTERKVEIESSSLLLDDFFKVRVAMLRFERTDGAMSDTVRRLSLERGDAVGVLLYHTEREQLLLVEQFRYPTLSRGGDGWVVEIMAGMVDEHESPESAARRETREETGYELESLVPISTFFVSPGGSSERVFLFYGEVSEASRSGEGGGLASENEDIALRTFSKRDLAEALRAGTLQDAKTVIAAMWFAAR